MAQLCMECIDGIVVVLTHCKVNYYKVNYYGSQCNQSDIGQQIDNHVRHRLALPDKCLDRVHV